MTYFIGRQSRSEFIPDLVEAWHRGRVLDRMLGCGLPGTTAHRPPDLLCER